MHNTWPSWNNHNVADRSLGHCGRIRSKFKSDERPATILKTSLVNRLKVRHVLDRRLDFSSLCMIWIRWTRASVSPEDNIISSAGELIIHHSAYMYLLIMSRCNLLSHIILATFSCTYVRLYDNIPMIARVEGSLRIIILNQWQIHYLSLIQHTVQQCILPEANNAEIAKPLILPVV